MVVNEDYILGVGTINTVKECEDKIQELIRKRDNTKDGWLKKELLKDINKLVKLKNKLKANEKGQFVTTSKLYKDLDNLAGLKKIQTRTTAIRGYRPITSGSIEIQNPGQDFYDIYFYGDRSKSKIREVVEGLESLGYTVQGYNDYSITVLNYIVDTKTEIMEDMNKNYYLCSIYGGYNCQELLADDIEVYAKDENSAKKEAIKIYKQEYNYSKEENPFELEAKIIKDDDLEEDIEKHDTLNPALFEGEELKPEVKNTIENAVDLFIQELEEEGVRFDLKDILLVGSNVNYNYTKDSDLDVHIIADSTHLDCPHNLYPLLYSAFRSMFNKNYDIRIKGIPLELYVEIDELGGKSNGVYSLKTGWVKKPVQKDIPDLDEEAFDKLFKEWEDKYFDLVGEQEVLTEGSQDSRRYFVKPYNKYCGSKKEILDILVHSGEKDCTIYTLKNLKDTKDVSHLGPRDVIYYYKDGKLYDKNNVKVMDYNLIIKNEENRKKFVNVDELPDQIFDKVYADRLTEFLKEEDKVLTEEKSDDIYKFIEALYNLRKESIANEGEFGLGNLVFKEFRNLGYLDNLKELRKKEKSKELSLEKLDEDINNVETRLDTLVKELSHAGIDWEIESLWDDEPYTECITILDGQEEKADDIICSIYGDCYVWVRDEDGNRRYCKIIGD